MGGGTRSANRISQSAVGSLIAGDAGNVVDLISSFAKWAIEDTIRIDRVEGKILLDSLVDVDEKRSRRCFGRVHKRNFHQASPASSLVVGTVSSTCCDYVLANSSDILRSYENCSARASTKLILPIHVSSPSLNN